VQAQSADILSKGHLAQPTRLDRMGAGGSWSRGLRDYESYPCTHSEHSGRRAVYHKSCVIEAFKWMEGEALLPQGMLIALLVIRLSNHPGGGSR